MNNLPILNVNQVGKSVKTSDGLLRILHGISFSVMAGDSIAIVGSSGSGKSTLLSLLAGLDVAGEGDILLMNQNLSLLNEDGRARIRGQNVGFVFQNFQLLPNLTALENVMLPLELNGQDPNEVRQLALNCLDQVGLMARLNHYPKTLSGGEQQRVALARAFVGKPHVLFADEPTGSLDEASGAKIIDLLFELNKVNESTLVLVTHDPILAARCGRQLHLQGGQLA